MTRPCQLKQSVQLLEQQRATACFIGEGFPLCATDLTLNAILMKSFVQGIETRSKIQPMEGIGIGGLNSLSNSRQGFAERISTYFRPSLTLNASAWAQSAPNCSASSMSGSQWSEKGSETNRLPVSQLRTTQNRMAFVRCSFGAEVVKATGAYP